MIDGENDGLSADEKAYFDSRGETDKADPPATDDDAGVVGGVSQEPEEEAQEGTAEGEVQDGARERPKLVPHAALHEAREDLKREKERARNFETTVNQRLEMLMRGQMQPPQAQQQAPAAQQKPDKNLDPIGYIDWLEGRVDSFEQTVSHRQQQSQEQVFRTQLAQVTQVDEADAVKHAPDYPDAKQFLIMSRGRELKALTNASDADIYRQLAQEEEGLRIEAVRNGVRPSIQIYRAALARGYAPKQAPQVNGEKIASIAEAQDSNKTMSSAGGSAAGGAMTARQLGDMSPEQFAAYAAKNGATVRRLMGG